MQTARVARPIQWSGKHPETGQAFVSAERSVVQCFFCERKVRLPESQHHWSARFPDCQTLLLHDEETAVALLRSDATRRNR